jgi:Tfp pilus assembly protein PilO
VSRSIKILIAAAIAIGAVAGYWKMVLAPKRQQAAQLEQQLTAAQSQIASAQATLAGYRSAKTTYRSNYSTTVRLGKAAPADDDSRSLMVQLDYAAKHSGVDFGAIDLGQSSGGSTSTSTSTDSNLPPGAISAGAYSELPIALGFNGTFAGLTNFFGRIERFVTVHGDRVAIDGRLVRISSIDIEPGESGWPSINAKLGAAAYIVPAAQSLAGSGSSAKAASSTPSAPSTTTSTATASTLR